MDTIKVKAKDPHRVAAFERHPAHPGGECWVTGDEVHQVAATPFIVQRIGLGFLIQVPDEPKVAAESVDGDEEEAKPASRRRKK